MIQVVFNGFVQGLGIALVAVAFCLVFSTTRRLLFVALGAIYTSAPYFFQQASGAGIPPVGSVTIALLLCSLVSLGCERLVHWPLESRWASPEANFLGSLGCFVVLEQALVLIWGPESHVFSQSIDHVHPIIGVNLASGQIITLVSALVVLILLFGFLSVSSWGLKCRALSVNPPLLSTMGINVEWVRAVVFLVAGCLVAVAGLLRANESGFSPYTGMTAVLAGLVATAVAGQGSFLGAACVAIVLGILRELTAFYLSAAFVEATSFLVLAVSLLVFPNGIRGVLLGITRPEES